MELVAAAGIVAALILSVLGIIEIVRRNRRKEATEPPAAHIDVPVAPPPAPVSGEPTLWLGRPATMGDSFVGRDDDLVKLKQLLGEHQGTVLCGGPGTGKSRLAAQFTHGRGGRGFWANGAATAERTLGGLAQAFAIDVEGKDDAGIAAEVRQCLAAEPPEALVVFDNVPDLAQTNDLLNAAGGMRVLITSRDVREKIVPGHVGRHLVEVLDLAGAIALLESQAPGCAGDEALPSIAEEVGRLPLALMTLGATLREGVRSPAELLDSLRAAPNAAELDAFTRALEGADLPHPAGVFAALTEGFERLSDDARAAFSRLCYVADLPVPDGLARALTGIGDDTDAYGRWLDECQRHAVLIKEPGQVRIHALTAAAVRATNPDAALETALTSAATRLTAISLPDPASTRAEIAHHEALETHAERQLDAMHPSRLDLEGALGVAYRYLGRAAESIAMFEAHTKRFEEALGAEHPNTWRSRNSLANAYQDAGRPAEAIALHKENLPVIEKVLGTEHPDTLTCRNNLAAAYGRAGRTDEAIALIEENLDVRVRVLGAAHPDTLSSLSNLAAAFGQAGRTVESIALIEENLPILEEVWGAEHPDTLGIRNNLAVSYQRAGRTAKAIALHEENLAVRARVLGAEHPHTLTSRGNLAEVYRDAGRDEDADRLMAGRDEDGNLR